jgi:electron transport complex protein RnfG
MQNKKKTTLIKDALALFLITLISGLALSFVYEITKEPIAVQKAEKTLEAYQRAYPEAVRFEEDEKLLQLAQETDLTTLDAAYKGTSIKEINKAFDENGNEIGYLIKVLTKNGYNKSTPMELAIAYAKDGTVKGIDLITIKETVNLGMLAAEPEFKDQFSGKQVEQFELVKGDASGNEKIDAISGATITSRAVTNAVNAGIGFLKEYATDLGGGANE